MYGLYFGDFPRVLWLSQAKSSTERVMNPRDVSRSLMLGPYSPETPTLPFVDSLLLPVGLKPTTPQ